jgi:hypothetical protein
VNGKPGWRLWAGIGAAIGAYLLAGFWGQNLAGIEEWLYRTGLTAATVLPAVFAAIYTRIGLAARRHGGEGWWEDEIGTSLVMAGLSHLPVTGPLGWVFWFDGGNLRSSWIAWVEVAGPALCALAWLRLCWVWWRISRASRQQAGTVDGGAS